MKNRILLIVPLCLSAFCSPASIAQVSYDHWNFLLRATNAQLTDSLAMPGVRNDATADYDNQYDIPRPPRPPSGNYLEVYFPHSGGHYPPILGTKYAIDFQGPDDPSWNLSVEASAAGPVTLRWDSAYVGSIEPRVQLFLRDLTTGSLTDMRRLGSYSFSYTTKRNFQIVGILKVGLRYLMEGFWNGAVQVKDTVTGYLAASTQPYAFVDSCRAPLSELGAGMLVFKNAPEGAYYCVVRHRSHLEIWSSMPLAVTKGTSSFTPYDFTTSEGQAFGVGALKQAGGVYLAWAGDVNQDRSLCRLHGKSAEKAYHNL